MVMTLMREQGGARRGHQKWLKEIKGHDEWIYEVWGQDLRRPMSSLYLLIGFQPNGMETAFTSSVPCSGFMVWPMKVLMLDYFDLILCNLSSTSWIPSRVLRPESGEIQKKLIIEEDSNRFIVNIHLFRFSEDPFRSLKHQGTSHGSFLFTGSLQVLRITDSAPGCFTRRNKEKTNASFLSKNLHVRDIGLLNIMVREHRKRYNGRGPLKYFHLLERDSNIIDPVTDIT